MPNATPTPPTDPTELPEFVNQNVEMVRRLREQADRNLGALHRPVERLFGLIARPATVYMLLLLIGGWIGLSLTESRAGWLSFDPAPFPYLQDLLAVLALITTVIVLIVQQRQGRVAEQRAELALQLNLLTEQKVAKLIALVEEQRRDSPLLRDRPDVEAQVMQQGADPDLILTALEQMQAGADLNAAVGAVPARRAD